jgi:YesN/AraC family two-component response regulator
VIEYNSMLNRDRIVFYHDLAKMPKEENFLYPEEMENHIINNLKIGNEETVCDTIHKLIAMNVEKNITPVTIRYLVVNIVGTIIKVVNQMEKKFQIPQLTFQTLFQENNISVMTSEVEKNVHTICDLVLQQNGDRNKPQGAALYQETLNFVKKHFVDKGLNVNMIADELGVHIVHLSRTFMEYNGGSLSDYITGIRLTEAKKLIRTGQKLEAISENVGFGSLRTFMRVFKKYEGVTPGQFKETMDH